MALSFCFIFHHISSPPYQVFFSFYIGHVLWCKALKLSLLFFLIGKNIWPCLLGGPRKEVMGRIFQLIFCTTLKCPRWYKITCGLWVVQKCCYEHMFWAIFILEGDFQSILYHPRAKPAYPLILAISIIKWMKRCDLKKNQAKSDTISSFCWFSVPPPSHVI